MAQGVRSDVFGDAGSARVFLDNSLDTTRSETAIITSGVGQAGVFAVV